MDQAKLIVLDPGHFHATLVQKDMYPWLSKRVSVYAPLGPELVDYLNRITLFNTRKESPTAWELDVHTGPDFLERMLREKPGTMVILTGRNRPKMDRIEACLKAGLHVLADKPWIIQSADLPRMEAALDSAAKRGLIAYDIMTERFEITSILQRDLVNDEGVFGKQIPGNEAEPGIAAKSIHHLMKLVAGAPLRRPAWFFDIAEYGEGLADVGTHVVDLVQWTAFPEQKLDYRKDIRFLSAKRWPTIISQSDFGRVTGEPDFPQYLAPNLRNGKLEYFCNNAVHYTLRGIHVKLDILWNWEAAAGAGDLYEAVFRGTRSRIEIRQRQVPDVYVVPSGSASKEEVFTSLKRNLDALRMVYPGLGMEERNGEARILIPDRYRVGHETHFAQVTNKFQEYLNKPETMPAWETPNMLAKYFVSTKGVEAARTAAG
jgi:predicted dehydrogenase